MLHIRPILSIEAEASNTPECSYIHSPAREKGKDVDRRDRCSSPSLTLHLSEFNVQSHAQNDDIVQGVQFLPQEFQSGSEFLHPHKDYSNSYDIATVIFPGNPDPFSHRGFDLGIGGVLEDLPCLHMSSLVADVFEPEVPQSAQGPADNSRSRTHGSAAFISISQPVDSGSQGSRNDELDYDGSEDGYDSMPELVSLSDSGFGDDHMREWHHDADSDDAGSLPDLEEVFDAWHPRNIDETILDSDEEEEMRAYWAEMERNRYPGESDSSSSESEPELLDDESAGDDDFEPEAPSTRPSTLRRIESGRTNASSERASPEAVMRRVTSLDGAEYASVRAQLDDALDDRAIAREWPSRSGELRSRWYQPIPLVDVPDRNSTADSEDEHASTRSYDPRLQPNEPNWWLSALAGLESRERDEEEDPDPRVETSVVHASPLDEANPQR